MATALYSAADAIRAEVSKDRWSSSSTRTTRSPLTPSGRGCWTGPDALHELRALDPERLDVRDRRGEDVPGPGDVLAGARGVLVEALVEDLKLALDRHVIGRGHPARAHHCEAALLVWIEPAQMQMGTHPT
jgi:hypothetical protein